MQTGPGGRCPWCGCSLDTAQNRGHPIWAPDSEGHDETAARVEARDLGDRSPGPKKSEIDEELQGFLDASIDEKIRRGMTSEDAQRAARVEIGSRETVRHKIWSIGWEAQAEALGQDLRYGLRQIRRSPGISTVAILSLALGIGANTAIFTLINDLLLKQLPVRDPQQLVSFGDGADSGRIESSSPGPYDIFPYEFYRRISQSQEEFDGICSFSSFPTAVSVRLASGSAGAANPGNQPPGLGKFLQRSGCGRAPRTHVPGERHDG